MAWFDENSSLYEEELDSLAVCGYKYSLDETAKNQGRLIINVQYEIDNKTFDLRCEYPPSYPYFSVKVFSPEFPPGRHLSPSDSGLCLFAEDQSNWSVADTLAKVIKEQIPHIYNSHLSPDSISINEAEEGYQISGQMNYENNSVIFAETIVIPEEVNDGNMTISVSEHTTIDTILTGCISSISITKDKKNSLSNVISERFNKKLKARWVKLNYTPEKIDPKSLLELACEINPALKTEHYNNIGKDGIDVIGLYFLEEKDNLEKVYNWVFIIRRKKILKKRKVQRSLQLVRSDYYTRDNLETRVPRLSGLEKKSVLLVGIGALGSQLALQLARAGLDKIVVVDHDIIQAGNLPRWLPAFNYIGWPKVSAIQHILLMNYPYLQCTPVHMHLGVNGLINTPEGDTDSHEITKKLIEEADIVIDCTAESNVSHFLSDMCSLLGKDYVWATATTGGWGGIVGKISPDESTGSWLKFSQQYADGTIEKPSSEEIPDVQPVGCFSPTFTGTGFDLDQISLMASRLSISLLLKNKTSSYNSFEWDVAVVNLWDEKTEIPIAPEWKTYKI